MKFLSQAPYEWTISDFLEYTKSGPKIRLVDGFFDAARPYGLYSLSNRLRLAWLVFTGEADVIRWPAKGPRAY